MKTGAFARVAAVGIAAAAVVLGMSGKARSEPGTASTNQTCCPGTGIWRLLDNNVVITDFGAFSQFLASNGFPIHSTGGEIIQSNRTMYLGVTNRGGPRQTIIDQYIAFKHPGTQYCETYTKPKANFCPPQGGVLFLQPAPIIAGEPIPPGGSYLRSEGDTNCFPPASPACGNTPGACWAIEFGDHTVEEIWVR